MNRKYFIKDQFEWHTLEEFTYIIFEYFISYWYWGFDRISHCRDIVANSNANRTYRAYLCLISKEK